MKVTFRKDYKRFLTVAEYETAKQIIEDMKEDLSTPKEYAAYAVNAIGKAYGVGYCEAVYECTAEISGNCRVNNSFTSDSGTLDIWLQGTAKTSGGFVEFGAYLTDIWNLDGDNSEAMAREHMFKVIYKREQQPA